MSTIIFSGIAFVAGFVCAWLIRTYHLSKTERKSRSIEGFLESERLMKEKLQKENHALLQVKGAIENEMGNRIRELQGIIREMDHDILLLQKDNEETEALLNAKEPALNELKKKLIEANNNIARYKGQLGLK